MWIFNIFYAFMRVFGRPHCKCTNNLVILWFTWAAFHIKRLLAGVTATIESFMKVSIIERVCEGSWQDGNDRKLITLHF